VIYGRKNAGWISLGGGVASVFVSDTPPAGAAANTLWWESDSGLLYVRYNDGNSTQWVIACPQPDISTLAPLASPTFTGDPKAPTPTAGDNDNSIATTAFVTAAVFAGGVGGAVRYDSVQSLTAPQAQQARQNIIVPPFDAMAANGLQLNGGMLVNQEFGGAGAGTATNNAYVTDGWRLQFGGTMAIGASAQSAANYFGGFNGALSVTVTTAQASLGAGDFVTIAQKLEGLRCGTLFWGNPSWAAPVTLCFWSAHHRTGVYSGSIRNGAGTRSYTFTYTQVTADTPQFNSVTIPGCPDGVWAVDNTACLWVTFTLASGSTFATAPNVWTTGNFFAVPTQVNSVAATTDVFRLTGVLLLPGNEGPSAARSPFVVRPYGIELIHCQRHYNKFLGMMLYGISAATNSIIDTYTFPQMRAAPSVTYANVTYGNGASGLGTHAIGVNFWRAVCSIPGPSPGNSGFDAALDARL
jgi:hypothetical protein